VCRELLLDTGAVYAMCIGVEGTMIEWGWEYVECLEKIK
jgi:hypothetical protein